VILSKEIKLPTGDTLVAYHSSKRARKDEYEREKAIEKIKKYINIKVSRAAKLEIDLDKLNHEIKFVRNLTM
jgi:hypothetical protein